MQVKNENVTDIELSGQFQITKKNETKITEDKKSPI